VGVGVCVCECARHQLIFVLLLLCFLDGSFFCAALGGLRGGIPLLTDWFLFDSIVSCARGNGNECVR